MRKEVNRTEFWGSPTLGRQREGEDIPMGTNLEEGSESGSCEATAVVQMGHGGGCGKGRSESIIF